ncbi:octopamine receptor Oamb-like [Dendronephthya gigantea]|uniref:octopamine receptor Oamb-like n=1 Tax=Dendronephthya gigantea TaxID=151771 RepID=UPI00106AB080|nr:octopamine receptor Oamb-like [Dendronephthya gigantea]
MVILYNSFGVNAKSPTTYFVTSLAIADLLVCSTYYPILSIEYSSIAAGERNIKHALFCEIASTVTCAGVALSIANLLAITTDRYIYVSRPLKYPMIMTWRKTYIILSIIWFAAVVNVNFVYFSAGKPDTHILYCRTSLVSFTFFFTLNVSAPLSGVLIFNYKIYNVARKQRRRIDRESISSSYAGNQETSSGRTARRRTYTQQLKQIKTFGFIVLALLLCIIPTVIVNGIQIFCKYCVPTSVYIASGSIFVANSAVNPIIYTVRSREYRLAFRRFYYKITNRNFES